jgi:hypothetical protein
MTASGPFTPMLPRETAFTAPSPGRPPDTMLCRGLCRGLPQIVAFGAGRHRRRAEYGVHTVNFMGRFTIEGGPTHPDESIVSPLNVATSSYK